MASSSCVKEEEEAIRAVIYGQCIGDAIGLLTEFLTKEEAHRKYGNSRGSLEYADRVDNRHNKRWVIGDWTDDSDQMIVIMQSIIHKNKVDEYDFALRLGEWSREGFPELGDKGGLGIGQTMLSVIRNPNFYHDPRKASTEVWSASGKEVAANGAVMRTAILGAVQNTNIDDVIYNTLLICWATHVDPRCAASCVAVTTAVAQMLGIRNRGKTVSNVQIIIDNSKKWAMPYLKGNKEFEAEFERYLSAQSIDDLALDEADKIGYTFKCMGAGFWALRQGDFRTALETIVFEGGDADTNGAVAGALLACKLGIHGLPLSWITGLAHKAWLDNIINKFIATLDNVKVSKASKSSTRQDDFLAFMSQIEHVKEHKEAVPEKRRGRDRERQPDRATTEDAHPPGHPHYKKCHTPKQ